MPLRNPLRNKFHIFSYGLHIISCGILFEESEISSNRNRSTRNGLNTEDSKIHHQLKVIAAHFLILSLGSMELAQEMLMCHFVFLLSCYLFCYLILQRGGGKTN